MATVYKLTTQEGLTRKGFFNETRWGENVTHRASGEGALCGPGWLHAYEHPLVAVLMNILHADIADSLLWVCEGEVGIRDGQSKVGCTSITTLRQIALPQVTTEWRVRVAIKCSLQVYGQPEFVAWATNWLNGTDRSESASRAVVEAAEAVAQAWAVAQVWVVASSAWAAAWAAEAASSVWASQVEAVEAAAWAWEAAQAAKAAQAVGFDFVAICEGEARELEIKW